MADIKKIKVGDTTYDIRDATAARSNHTHTPSEAGAAAAHHLYHTWDNNTNYYDSYEGGNMFRIVTENMYADCFRFQASTVSNLEYYNGSSWASWNFDLSNLFDGNARTGVSIPYANRKFRFQLTANGGWPTTGLFMLQGTWFDDGGWPNGQKSSIIIETRANTSDAWSQKASFDLSGVEGMAGHTLSSLHTGNILYRITIEIAPWTNTSKHCPLQRLCLFSNYNGGALETLSYTGTGNITTSKSISAGSFIENGKSLTDKYLGKTAKAADADKLDGNDSTYYLNLDNINDGSTRKLANYIPKSLTSTKGDIIYASDANTPARLNIGSNGQFLSIANGIPTWVDQTISGTVTKEAGGITKGHTYTNADIISVLSDLLFTDVAPSGLSITFLDASDKKINTTLEYGTKKTISKVQLSFTKGSKDITSVKIKSGDAILFSNDSVNVNSGGKIDLTTSKKLDGSTDCTISCTISDGKLSTNTSANIKYAYYTYSKLTTSTSPDTSDATRQNQSDADNTYDYTAGQYLWLYSRYSGKTIHTYVSGSWPSVNTTPSGEITLTLSSGATATYYAYRTDQFTATGQARYRLE